MYSQKDLIEEGAKESDAEIWYGRPSTFKRGSHVLLRTIGKPFFHKML